MGCFLGGTAYKSELSTSSKSCAPFTSFTGFFGGGYTIGVGRTSGSRGFAKFCFLAILPGATWCWGVETAEEAAELYY